MAKLKLKLNTTTPPYSLSPPWCEECGYEFPFREAGWLCPRCDPEPMEKLPIAHRLVALMDTFPVLESAPRDSLHALATWGTSHGGMWAVRFILYVHGPDLPVYYGLGSFRMHKALSRWDMQQREAFGAWASNPWWVDGA